MTESGTSVNLIVQYLYIGHCQIVAVCFGFLFDLGGQALG